MYANHVECHTCHQPVRRGDAVIRPAGDLVTQYAWHPSCYTIWRGVKDTVAVEVEAEERIGMTLGERLARAGYRS